MRTETRLRRGLEIRPALEPDSVRSPVLGVILLSGWRGGETQLPTVE